VHIAKHHYHVTTQNITNTDEEKEKHKSVYANFLPINAKPLLYRSDFFQKMITCQSCGALG
jgi:hypothetical protein